MTGSLFQRGSFKLASGAESGFKIECDSLTHHDWETLAWMLAERVPHFGWVRGVPTGGVALADAIRPYATEGPLLLVDDVWTTGGSMRRLRDGKDTIGAVVFYRGNLRPPKWLTPLFVLNPVHRSVVGR